MRLTFRRVALASLLSVACAAPRPAPRGTALPYSFSGLLTRERSLNRAFIIELYATWCAPCTTFEREVLHDDAVIRALKRIDFVRFDIDKEEGNRAMQSIGRVSIPAVFVVAPDGRILDWELGGHGVARFLLLIDEAADSNDEAALASARDDEPDAHLLLRAARRARALGFDHRALAIYDRVIARGGDENEPFRAEAAWDALRLLNRQPGAKRDARQALHFASEHPRSPRAVDALLAAALGGAPVMELESRFTEDVGCDDVHQLVGEAYSALAAHAYDAALLLAQAAVKKQRDAMTLHVLAEVYHYRHEPAMAVQMGVRAVEQLRGNNALATDVDRYRAADGRPSPIVEMLREQGVRDVQVLFGVPN
jgi:hypothetical protein